MKILDANYEMADLDKIVQGATQLNRIEKRQLHELLYKFEQGNVP